MFERYALESERAVLCSVMLRPDTVLEVAEIIRPDDFYHESHRLIYHALYDLYELGEGIDAVALADRLQGKGHLERAGGVRAISEIMNASPTAANVKYHARIVREKAELRRAHDYIQNAQIRLEEGEDVHAVIRDMGRDLADVSTPNSAADIATILAELEEGWERREEEAFIPCDFKFNSLIPGKFPGHIWVIAGYTSVGKSTMLAQDVVDVCDAGGRVLIFSTEDSRRDKAIKLISNLANITQRRLYTGHIEGLEDRIRTAEATLREWAPVIYDGVYDVDEICLKAKKHRLRDGINVVYLDFIQNLQGKQGSEYESLKYASSRIQQVAKDLGVTFVVLSQIDNMSARDGGQIIGTKGSGNIAAAADIVLWLKRAGDRGLDCEVKKNRPFGETGIVGLQFSEWWTRIERRA